MQQSSDLHTRMQRYLRQDCSGSQSPETIFLSHEYSATISRPESLYHQSPANLKLLHQSDNVYKYASNAHYSLVCECSIFSPLGKRNMLSPLLQNKETLQGFTLHAYAHALSMLYSHGLQSSIQCSFPPISRFKPRFRNSGPGFFVARVHEAFATPWKLPDRLQAATCGDLGHLLISSGHVYLQATN